MKWRTAINDDFNEDWMFSHYRYKFSNEKLDTDLFEVRDGSLMKICGDGRIEFSSIEILDEESKVIQTCKKCGVFVFTADGRYCLNGHIATPPAAAEHPTPTVSAEEVLDRHLATDVHGNVIWVKHKVIDAMNSFANQFRTPAPEGENVFDKNGEQVKDGDNLIYIGTNMSGVEVRAINGRLIVIGQFNCGYLSEWIAAKDFQSIEIDKTNYDSTTPTTPAPADSVEVAAIAQKLLRSIISADQNVVRDYNSSDMVIRDLFNQCTKLVKCLSGYQHKPAKGEVVTLEDLAITASEMEWPDEIMVTIKKLVKK